MLEQFLDNVGNWNPQLRKELKTQLTLPNLTIATFALVQMAVPNALIWDAIGLILDRHADFM